MAILSITPTVTGAYPLISGQAALEQAVYDALLTEPGSVDGFPDYGAGLKSFVTRTVTDEMLGDLRSTVYTALGEFLDVLDVRVTISERIITIIVTAAPATPVLVELFRG